MQELMSRKGEVEAALLLAMELVVYDFAINERDAGWPNWRCCLGYYAPVVPELVIPGGSCRRCAGAGGGRR